MKVHSVVEIITNSSTELFIIPKEKIKFTKKQVREVLTTYWEAYKNSQKILDPEGYKRWLEYERLTENSSVEDILLVSTALSDYNPEFWDYKLREGDMTIEGQGDNMIPYELFDLIEFHFNAKRYHLG